jgi:competence protein ComEC
VLRVEAGGRAMLLTSDIEARDEAALLARDRALLAADVLLVPHHGSRTSSTAEFLAAVDARDAIIPAGYRNRFGHPKAEVVARLEAAGARLWRSDRDGAVSVRLGPGMPAPAAWRRERPRYWQASPDGP